MEVKLDLGIEQLANIIRQLPPDVKEKLKSVLDEPTVAATKGDDFRGFLLNGPVFTKEQIERMEETRNAFNQWLKP